MILFWISQSWIGLRCQGNILVTTRLRERDRKNLSDWWKLSGKVLFDPCAILILSFTRNTRVVDRLIFAIANEESIMHPDGTL